MAEVPEHLLRRAAERKAALAAQKAGASAEGGGPARFDNEALSSATCTASGGSIGSGRTVGRAFEGLDQRSMCRD